MLAIELVVEAAHFAKKSKHKCRSKQQNTFYKDVSLHSPFRYEVIKDGLPAEADV